jgi:hypothetical protein
MVSVRLAILVAALALALPGAASAGPITLSPKPVDFGTVAVDPTGYLPYLARVQVTNTGSRPLTILGISWVFHGPGTFSDDPSCGSAAIEVLQPGESCDDVLVWDPDAPGYITQSKWCISTLGHRTVCVRIAGRAALLP